MNTDKEILSSDGKFIAHVKHGPIRDNYLDIHDTPWKPYHPTTVTVLRRDTTDTPVVVWHEDSESTGVAFSNDGLYVEILWQMASVRLRLFWRAVYHLPSGFEVARDMSERHRDRKTSHSLSPAQGTVSLKISEALERMMPAGPTSHENAIAMLRVLVDSGIDVSSNNGLVRLLLRILLRDISSWSDDEVALRLLAARLLHRADIRDTSTFLRDLLPRGVVREPNRQEHNRLLDEFIAKLVNGVNDKHGKTNSKWRWGF